MGMVSSPGLNMGMLGVYWTKISWIHSEVSIDEPFFGHREGNHPRFSHPLVLLNDDMWANTENTLSLPGWTSIVWSLGFKTQRIAAKVQKSASYNIPNKKSLFSTETILCSTKQRSVNSVATCNVFGSLATKQLWNTAKQWYTSPLPPWWSTLLKAFWRICISLQGKFARFVWHQHKSGQ